VIEREGREGGMEEGWKKTNSLPICCNSYFFFISYLKTFPSIIK
jgi:hypothetical protein